MLRIPNFNTVVRTLIGGVPTQPFSMATLPQLGTPNRRLAEALKQLSSAKFGKPRAVVEKEIFDRLETKEINAPQPPFASPPNALDSFGQFDGRRTMSDPLSGSPDPFRASGIPNQVNSPANFNSTPGTQNVFGSVDDQSRNATSVKEPPQKTSTFLDDWLARRQNQNKLSSNTGTFNASNNQFSKPYDVSNTTNTMAQPLSMNSNFGQTNLSQNNTYQARPNSVYDPAEGLNDLVSNKHSVVSNTTNELDKCYFDLN